MTLEATSVVKLRAELRKIAEAVRKRARSRYAGKLVTGKTYPDDTYLVSYPRSGNTWARFMLANLVRPPGIDVTFQTIGRILPDIHADRDQIETLSRPRILKSHLPFQPQYPRVIYLVRDGRDVYVSYYHYQLDSLPPGTDLAHYLQMKHWPCSWGAHVASWLGSCLARDRFLLVPYSQLYEQPLRTLREMAAFAGLDPSQAQIQEAIRISSFDSMRQIEEVSGHPREHRYSGRFVRRGKVGGWRAHFGPKETAAFKALEADNQALVQLGYENTLDW